ncbi:YflT domain-containing protein [Microbacterium sp. GXF7504]
MSMSGGAPFAAGSAEAGETVASFTAYEGAQKAVSQLIAAEVPAREIAIVGEGLRSVERVTGRLGYATAARSGAVNGLMLGVLFAAIFVLGSPTVALQVFVGVLLLGVALGMLLNIVMFAIVRRKRDYASVMQVAADRYEVKVTAANAAKARAALGTRPVEQAPAVPPAAATEPPRYGERIPAEPPRYGERITPSPAPVQDAGRQDEGDPQPDATAADADPEDRAAPPRD